MFNIGGGEVLVILLIALIVLGPDKLPNAARQAGKYLGDFRRMSNGFKNELKDAMDLGDLGDLMSGSSKPQSPGGPTVQPTASEPVITPSSDAAPIPVTASNGDAPATGASLAAAATNGGVTNGAAASTTNGSSAAAPGADAPAVVRKRSIEVDGPSTSFD